MRATNERAARLGPQRHPRWDTGAATDDPIDLFEGLKPTELDGIRAMLDERALPEGTEIIAETEPGAVVYLILEGSVKIALEQRDGTEVILSVLGSGEIVGEMSVVDSLGRSATVTTLEPTRIADMDRDTFWRVLREIPGLTYNLVELLSRRIRLANVHVEGLASLDVAGRLARQLLALGYEYGEPVDDGTRISIPLTQSELAALVGASRVRVNQVLSGWRRRGLVSTGEDRRITIRDDAALARRCR